MTEDRNSLRGEWNSVWRYHPIDEDVFAARCYTSRRQKTDVRNQKHSTMGKSDRVRLPAAGEKVFAALMLPEQRTENRCQKTEMLF